MIYKLIGGPKDGAEIETKEEPFGHKILFPVPPPAPSKNATPPPTRNANHYAVYCVSDLGELRFCGYQ